MKESVNNINVIDKRIILANVSTAITMFTNLKKLFEEFNNHNNDIETFSHHGVKYFYELELKNGEEALKKEIDFVINYFTDNANDENEKNIYINFDKNKFVEYIKKITKREKILIKCKDIYHIINIFLNENNYFKPKERKKKEKQAYQKAETTQKNLQNDWDFLDFESVISKAKTKKMPIQNLPNNMQEPPPVDNTNNIISQKIKNLLDNSQFMKLFKQFNK